MIIGAVKSQRTVGVEMTAFLDFGQSSEGESSAVNPLSEIKLGAIVSQIKNLPFWRLSLIQLCLLPSFQSDSTIVYDFVSEFDVLTKRLRSSLVH